MRIVFMGTPDYAESALNALADAGHEIALVVTQPDRPVGRGGRVSVSPVKKSATERGYEVFQPERIREETAVRKIKEVGADIGVVAAFGQILPAELLNAPRFGCVNIHASLLPKYRGSSPIQQAILDGERTTGVTVMQMDEGVDTGDILFKESVEISPAETAGSLFDKLSEAGAKLIVKALDEIEAGRAVPVKQDGAYATKTGQISKDMGLVRWNESAIRIERLIRAMDPWPSAYTRLPDSKLLKLWRAEVIEGSAGIGEVCGTDADSFTVGTGEGLLRVKEVQLEGRKRMSVRDFLLGFRLENGIVLG